MQMHESFLTSTHTQLVLPALPPDCPALAHAPPIPGMALGRAALLPGPKPTGVFVLRDARFAPTLRTAQQN
eukprot:1550531-Prymnesium_polylepis.1